MGLVGKEVEYDYMTRTADLFDFWQSFGSMLSALDQYINGKKH